MKGFMFFHLSIFFINLLNDLQSQIQPQFIMQNFNIIIAKFFNFQFPITIIICSIKMTLFAVIIKNNPKFLFSHLSRKNNFFKVQNITKLQKNIILPTQYPKNLTDNSFILKRSRLVTQITPKHQIPQNKLVQNAQLINSQFYQGKWQSPINSHSLNIGFIGPVNSGKSQLLGKIIGKKLSAVSPKANTTSQTIEAFKSFEIQSQQQGIKNVQLKFYDTAGMMYKKTGFVSKGWKVLSEIDFSILVIDSTKKFDQITKQSIKRLEGHRNYQNFMKALVLNKIDLVDNRRKFHTLIGQIQKYGKFDKIFYVSALTGYGIKDLQDYLIKMAKKRQWEQPKQALTTLTQTQIYQEMLKQCLYHRSYKEVPYNTKIQCVSISLKSDNLEQIKFRLIVQSQNQQRMIIGTSGRNIKWIIDRFKVYFTQTYKKQTEVFIDVRIKDKLKQNQFLSDQTFFDKETQEKFNKQKIAVVQQYLHSQGKFRKQNMIQWNSFFQNQNTYSKNLDKASNKQLSLNYPQKSQIKASNLSLSQDKQSSGKRVKKINSSIKRIIKYRKIYKKNN